MVYGVSRVLAAFSSLVSAMLGMSVLYVYLPHFSTISEGADPGMKGMIRRAYVGPESVSLRAFIMIECRLEQQYHKHQKSCRCS